MHITTLILTYSDRGMLLEKTIPQAFACGSDKVLVICNNSTPASLKKIKNIQSQYLQNVYTIELNSNNGTAIALSYGFDEIRKQKDSEYIWIIDDDNIPAKNALSIVSDLWKKYAPSEDALFMTASIRRSKQVYYRSLYYGKPDMIIGRPDYFRAFHILKLFSLIKRRLCGSPKTVRLVDSCGTINAVPYGGMFFHKNLLDQIGYPNKDYYIYHDDHEFSHRIVDRGGKILMSVKSVIDDVDPSWNTQGLGVWNIARHNNHTLLYYSIRNRIILERQYTIKYLPMYYINSIIYLSIVCGICLSHFNIKNALVFFEAFLDGNKGRLGINPKYVLK